MDTKEKKFWAHVERDNADNCWAWQGGKSKGGYGILQIDKERWYAHRLSYTIHYGPIPEGMHVCHRCDNPPCCNPSHLFAGTMRDNMQDKVAKGRHPVGEKSSNVILTEVQVAQMKSELADRREPFSAIAKRYGVDRKAVEAIARQVNWAHVAGPDASSINGRSFFNSGSRNRCSKLSESDVENIRSLIASHTMTQRAIAKQYGVAETTISAVKREQNWKRKLAEKQAASVAA